jgi:NodT family efflux transporter outer membrane factor (OMF) lipoprotein
MLWKWFYLLVLVSPLTACMVGANYVPPQKTIPVTWEEPSATQSPEESLVVTKEPLVEWWQTLDDPQLVHFIDLAVQNNFDLRIAVARVREVRAFRKGTAAGLYPRIDMAANFIRQRGSENAFGPNPSLAQAGLGDLEGNVYQAGFDAGWEIDIFGGIRRAVEAADARLDAAIENRRDVLVTITAEVAIIYLELRGNQRRMAVAENNIRIQKDTLDFVEKRYRTGLGSELAVVQARSQLRATESFVPTLKAAIRAGAYQLGVLTGQMPAMALTELQSTKPLPLPPKLVPVGLPSDLLLRRPDLRRAERQLAASTSDIGTARADLFPRFFLTGSYGYDSTSLSDLFTWSSRTWSLGPTVRWPIFQGGRIRANIEATEARNEAALARYEQAVISALAEVESALAGYVEVQEERRKLAESVQASVRAVELAKNLYELGLSDFLTVLDADGRLTLVEDRLVVSEITMVTRLIQVYKALGGGWEKFEENEKKG